MKKFMVFIKNMYKSLSISIIIVIYPIKKNYTVIFAVIFNVETVPLTVNYLPQVTSSCLLVCLLVLMALLLGNSPELPVWRVCTPGNSYLLNYLLTY